jgi:alkylhydroperoxidase/carboxymuconolactone decarboxylase family protein YurZ
MPPTAAGANGTNGAGLKEEFVAKRGYWNPFWDQLLEEDPDFFTAYLQFSVPSNTRALSDVTRELIYIAIDASATHLFQPGIRIHIRNALALGATKREILEVLEAVSVIGIHSVAVGLPVLLSEVERADTRKETSSSEPASED